MNDVVEKSLAAVAVAIVLIIGMSVYSSTFEAVPATENYSVVEENITVQVPPGNWTALGGSNIDEHAESLVVSAVHNGTAVQATAEYNVNSTAPEYAINFTSKWDATRDPYAYVTYTYSNKPVMARNSSGNISSGFELGGIVPLVLFAALILGAILAFGGRRRGGF